MIKPTRRRLLAAAFLLLVGVRGISAGFAAGVTIISHGLNSDIDDWVIAMARSIPNYRQYSGSNFVCYEISVTDNGALTASPIKLAGGAPSNNLSGEIFIKLDWRGLANNSYSTYQVAAAVVPRLLQTNFISELNGHALAELPIHLIGHSRGGSLACQMSRLLGTNGVWVDHLTTLDPHPLNNDGFNDSPLYSVVDAPARTYENVLFHDNYYQTLNVLFYGEPVAGAFVRQLTDLGGGYGGLAGSHSDVHLWYHGTVDLNVPTDDSVASITIAERQAWWTPNEAYGRVAGFYYSLIGGGDRLGTNRPAGPGTSRVRAGYNQRWDLGAGANMNRTVLTSNNGSWPNVIRLELAGTNLLAQGESNALNYYMQWAKPSSSNATLSIYLDDDFNPYNANERLVRQVNVSGNGTDQIGVGTINFDLNSANSVPGVHTLYAVITGAGHSRYLYAPELVTVVSSFRPVQLAISGASGVPTRIDVMGSTGQRVALQSSSDFRAWQPRATNWLASNLWSYFETQPVTTNRFYRAILQ